MKNIQVLIIDDDDQSLERLARMLTYERATCTTVQNSNQLLGALGELTYTDVIFLDVKMSSMDGYEALEVLREACADRHIPIIAHTVYTEQESVVAARGFDGFLAKPLNAARFSGYFRRILDGKQVWIMR